MRATARMITSAARTRIEHPAREGDMLAPKLATKLPKVVLAARRCTPQQFGPT
jgi:hypothetical protein